MTWPRVYFAVQSALIAGWWIVLLAWPATRAHFSPAFADPTRWLLLFLPLDMITALAGAWVAGSVRYAGRVGLAVSLIGITVQTLACLAASLRTDSAWLGTCLMALASMGSLLAAGRLVADASPLPIFRPAPPMSMRQLVVRTTVQAAILWALFLLVLPWSIMRIERSVGLVHEPHAMLIGGGAAVFVLGAILNIWAAATMLRDGLGTPLPMQTARRLVVRGPYRFVRNPMAMGGLTQGLGVALACGSPVTALYVVLGGVVWHVLVRPAEERDLQDRFGEPFLAYQRDVRCWIP